ncbi:YcnI family protein [Mycobacterium yunnanensis]|uniref:YcnI family protein n=1 Tax=Mycobacterium yunnanensis TaxID=368477 RepID=A0A9X3C3A1_9MYCO|nr:YcnI family protein [Mycobacterium yunnanensis]MCV7422601.1 YcnI family protein [Mycobacterium yunnanensis]
MRTTHRATSRALITTAATAAVMSVAVATGPAIASAHVHVDADGASPGSTSVLTFRVPGESETGSLTTQFSVTLPNVPSARTEVMPGWTARLDRDAAAGTVRSVTWTAAPSVGISSDQFALFHVSVTLPNQPTVTLPATQTYSDGTVVRWDQPPLPGGGEPEHPAPELTLSGPPAGGDDDHGQPMAPTATATAEPGATAQPGAAAAAGPDDTARWLAGGALVLAAVGFVVALTGRRRT